MEGVQKSLCWAYYASPAKPPADWGSSEELEVEEVGWQADLLVGRAFLEGVEEPQVEVVTRRAWLSGFVERIGEIVVGKRSGLVAAIVVGNWGEEKKGVLRWMRSRVPRQMM